MDSETIEIVRNYIVDHLDKSDKMPEFEAAYLAGVNEA